MGLRHIPVNHMILFSIIVGLGFLFANVPLAYAQTATPDDIYISAFTNSPNLHGLWKIPTGPLTATQEAFNFAAANESLCFDSISNTFVISSDTAGGPAFRVDLSTAIPTITSLGNLGATDEIACDTTTQTVAGFADIIVAQVSGGQAVRFDGNGNQVQVLLSTGQIVPAVGGSLVLTIEAVDVDTGGTTACGQGTIFFGTSSGVIALVGGNPANAVRLTSPSGSQFLLGVDTAGNSPFDLASGSFFSKIFGYNISSCSAAGASNTLTQIFDQSTSRPSGGFESGDDVCFDSVGNLILPIHAPIPNFRTLQVGTGTPNALGSTLQLDSTIVSPAGCVFLLAAAVGNTAPTVPTPIPDQNKNEDVAPFDIDLTLHFDDTEDGAAALDYTETGNTNPTLVSSSFSSPTLTLTVTGDDFGTSDITIRGTDSGGLFVEDTFTLTVASVNDQPTTTGIADVATDEDVDPAGIDLRTSFEDVEDADEDLTYTIQNNDNAGLVTPSITPLAADHTLTLALVANANGEANITIRATDTDGDFIATTFKLTVAPVNDAPTAVIDNAATNEDTLVAIPSADLLSNDTDPDLADVPPDTKSLVSVQNPQNGAVAINGANVDFTPALHFNDSQGTASFEYTMEDGSGVQSSATVTVAVTAVNDAPTAVDDDVVTDEDTPTTDVLGNDTDPDLADVPPDTKTIVAVTQPTEGAVAIAIGGATLSFDPTGSAVLNALAVGEFALDSFTYTMEDGSAVPSIATVDVTINGVNDAPTATPNSYATDEDTAINGITNNLITQNTGDGVDSDPDTTDNPKLFVSAFDAVSVKGAAVNVNPDGTFTYNPAGIFETLDEGEPDTDSFTYTVNDTNGGTDTATVSIDITGVNDAPEITIVGNITFDFHEAGLPVYDDDDNTANPQGAVAGGATVTDVEDDAKARPISIGVTNSVDSENPGTYTVVYDVTDNDPTTPLNDQQTRTVIVRDTTPPILSFTIDDTDADTFPNDRDEADEGTETANFQFSATATDAPRTTAPSVICTDEDGTERLNAAGGTDNVPVTLRKGIVTLFCVADDGSNSSPEDPTSPADVDTDAAQNDFIISHITFDPTNLTPFWNQNVPTGGLIFGFLPGESFRAIYDLDGTDTQLIVSGNPDADTDNGLPWVSSHVFSEGTSRSDQTIEVELFGSPIHSTAPSQVAMIQAHPTEFQGVSALSDVLPHSSEQTKTGSLVDVCDVCVTNPNIPIDGVIIITDGDGTAGFPFDTFTDTNGDFSITGNTVGRTVTLPEVVTLNLIFEGDDSYEPPLVQHQDDYNTLIQTTDFIFNFIPSVVAGSPVTITGSLFGQFGQPVPDKTLSFTVENGPAFVTPPGIPDSITSQSITIFTPGSTLDVVGNNLQAEPGTIFRHPSFPTYIDVSLEPMDPGTSVTFDVFDTTDHSYDLTVSNPGTSTFEFPLEYSTGISRFEVREITGATIAPISQLVERNEENLGILVLVFDNSVDNQFLIFDGVFGTLGTPVLAEFFGYTIRGTWAGDLDYADSTAVSDPPFDAIFNPDITQPGATTGTASSIVPESGIGIVALACKAGDTDNDSLCDEWEADWLTNPGFDPAIQDTPGVPFTVGTNPTFYYPLTGTTFDQDDLIVEIDAMAELGANGIWDGGTGDDGFSHEPSATAMTNVAATFSSIPSPYTVNLIQSVDDRIPHEDLTSVWDGFNDLKVEWFGTSDEQITLDSSMMMTNVGSTQLLLAFEGDLLDSTGNGFTGAIGGTGSAAELYMAGPDGEAFDFNGFTHIAVTDAPFDFANNAPFSIATWFKTNVVGTNDIIIGKLSGTGNGYQMFLVGSNNQIQLRYGSGSDFVLVRTDGLTLRDDEFHHVVFTYDGTSTDASGISIYVDGDLTTPTVIAREDAIGNAANGEVLVIGNQRESASLFFAGEMDDVRFYDFELVPGQITSLFDSFVKAPISRYEFNGDLTDSVGSNDGSENAGTATFVDGKAGQAVDLTGSIHIETADGPFDFANNAPFSITAWIKTDVTGVTDLLFGKLAGNGIGYQIFLLGSDNQLKVRIGTGADNAQIRTVGMTLRDDVFHHVAFVYDGTPNESGLAFYVDGVAAPATVDRADTIGNVANGVVLTLGNQRPGSSYFFDGQMDDVRVYDFALENFQVASIASNPNAFGTTSDFQSLLEVSNINLSTPNTALTLGKTEARITLSFDVTHTASGALLNGDSNTQVDLSSATFGINQDTAAVGTVAHPTDNTKNILTAIVPINTNTQQTLADVGTIKIPLVSDILISSVSERNEPTASSTLLTAKAQAYRYGLFVHSIGGSSGQSEVRGNDFLEALGQGFDENDATHAGTEGDLKEVSGTYLHELGHILNLLHGGPVYLLDAPTVTIDESDQNCVPIQKSIMSYTGQLPSYLGEDWALRFNEVGRVDTGDARITLDETLLDEQVAFTALSGTSPTIIYATLASGIQDTITTTADGSLIDWTGDQDFNDAYPVPSPAHFDINNFGIPGCESSEGELFEIFNEPANFDFNFQDGAYGVFDGAHPTGQPEKTDKIRGIEILYNGAFVVLPPIEIDGTELVNAGRVIPLKFLYFNNPDDPNEPLELLNFETVRADLVFEDGTIIKGDSGAEEALGFFNNPSGAKSHYQNNWDTIKDYRGSTVGVRYVVLLPDLLGGPGDTIDRILIIPTENNANTLTVGGLGVTVKVVFK